MKNENDKQHLRNILLDSINELATVSGEELGEMELKRHRLLKDSILAYFKIEEYSSFDEENSIQFSIITNIEI